MGGNGLASGIFSLPLRGYDDASIGIQHSLTTSVATTYAAGGFAYSRYVAEVRYILSMEPIPIYFLTFAEAGNVWSDWAHADPFSLKRAAGVGARVQVPAVGMIGSGELWSYLWPSLVVLGIGMVFAAVAGIAMGLLLARFWVLDVALGVYITFLYSIPTVALVPLIVLWAGYEMMAKIIILFLFAFFPMAINTYQGVKNVDARLIEVGRAFRCSEGQLWANIVLPGALPFIVTGLRLAVGRGLIGMVLADLYTAVSGIGFLISRAAATYQVDKVFVPIVTLGVLGVTLTALLRVLEVKIAPWTKEGQRE